MNYRDNFKIRFTKKPEFTVNEKEKSVKCYITCTVYVPTSLSDILFMENFQTFAKGYAKCDDKDKFDVATGKKIALARAESKIYWKVKTLANQAKKTAARVVKAAEMFEAKTHNLIAHNKKYVDAYIQPTKAISANEFFSRKAKSQPRDEQGRFTACTNNNKTKVCEKKAENCQKKGVINIKINRI